MGASDGVAYERGDRCQHEYNQQGSDRAGRFTFSIRIVVFYQMVVMTDALPSEIKYGRYLQRVNHLDSRMRHALPPCQTALTREIIVIQVVLDECHHFRMVHQEIEKTYGEETDDGRQQIVELPQPVGAPDGQFLNIDIE